MRRFASLVLVLFPIAACRGGGGGPAVDASAKGDGGVARPEPAMDFSRDLLATSLSVDVSNREATAVIELAPSSSTAASFEVGDLEILEVRDSHGPLRYDERDGRLDVGVPAGDQPAEIEVEYRYQAHGAFDGATDGFTFLWPYYCGNLFPCKSSPDDGLTFELSVTGAGAGTLAVFPDSISADAPSYMIAWAVGEYEYIDLGDTAAGTEVGVYYLPGEMETAVTATSNLRAAFEWLEQTYGEYTFGDRVASVSADWGPGAFGGMEHHPLWHVGSADFSSEETHVHEAAHGWFGNGVRIACWEDFVLSEGTVSYLAARTIGEVAGQSAGDEVWASYQSRLDGLQSGGANKIAWPQGCGEIDILEDGLFGTAPYMKGAFFFRALEERVGVEALDAALAAFYADHAGEAATMQALLDRIESETGYDPSACAQAWLRSEAVPQESSCP